MQNNSLWKTLMLGKGEVGKKGMTEDEGRCDNRWTETSMRSHVAGHDWAAELTKHFPLGPVALGTETCRRYKWHRFRVLESGDPMAHSLNVLAQSHETRKPGRTVHGVIKSGTTSDSASLALHTQPLFLHFLWFFFAPPLSLILHNFVNAPHLTSHITPIRSRTGLLTSGNSEAQRERLQLQCGPLVFLGCSWASPTAQHRQCCYIHGDYVTVVDRKRLRSKISSCCVMLFTGCSSVPASYGRPRGWEEPVGLPSLRDTGGGRDTGDTNGGGNSSASQGRVWSWKSTLHFEMSGNLGTVWVLPESWTHGTPPRLASELAEPLCQQGPRVPDRCFARWTVRLATVTEATVQFSCSVMSDNCRYGLLSVAFWARGRRASTNITRLYFTLLSFSGIGIFQWSVHGGQILEFRSSNVYSRHFLRMSWTQISFKDIPTPQFQKHRILKTSLCLQLSWPVTTETTAWPFWKVCRLL